MSSRGAAGQFPAAPRRVGSGALLTLINGVLAGVGSVYDGTRSVLITVIAAALAIVLAVARLTLAPRRAAGDPDPANSRTQGLLLTRVGETTVITPS
jgi:hypothetical protein